MWGGQQTCPAYHAQGGEPTHQQPEEVEEGMKVNVVGDEQDDTVPKEAIALGREMRGSSLGLEWPSAPWWGLWLAHPTPGPQTPGEQQTKAFLILGSLCPLPGSAPYQQCQHLEHGDLGIAQVGKEINER